MEKKKRRIGIITEVAILFAIGVLIVGLIAFISQSIMSHNNVKSQRESMAARVSEEVEMSVTEYPAYKWLVRYWYEHPKEMDIEYDVDYTSGKKTEKKCRLLNQHHPELQLKYATTEEIEALSASDQKLYAEITYSWLITRINEIKRSHGLSFLFCAITDHSFTTQFFLFSAADPGAVRGTNYEETYPLGTTVEVSESLQNAMREARDNSSYLADAGKYMDYYVYLGSYGEHEALIGMTYDLSRLQSEVATWTWSGTVFSMIIQICLSVICLVLIFLFILRPLEKVIHQIRFYKKTKDSETVTKKLMNVKSYNEIGQLSEDVISLVQEIDDYLNNIKTITAEKERISTELDVASGIQEGMLPHIFPAFPDRLEFDVYASMHPAKMVGGDFYDMFLIDEDHLALVMADVSGKGIPAALFMMASKILINNFSVMGNDSPARILSDVNNQICKNNAVNMFVTVWLGILEISTGKLKAANAGHEYPIIKKAGGQYEILKDKHGFVIGGMEGMVYIDYELQLSPGDSIFQYTDGVTEAVDAENVQFGMDRLLEVLNREPEAPPDKTLKNVTNAIKGFVKGTPQFDDITMMCMTYLGKQSSGKISFVENPAQNKQNGKEQTV